MVRTVSFSMNNSQVSKTGPILKVLASGLNLWIRSKCQSVGDLSLDIYGSGLDLLRGKLSSVCLKGSEISFNNVSIHNVSIKTKSLKASVDIKKLNQAVRLDQPFHIDGHIEMSESGVNDFLSSDKWGSIATEISSIFVNNGLFLEAFLKNKNLHFRLNDEDLGKIFEEHFEIRADYGTVVIYKNEKEFVLPMDDAIKIKKAFIENRKLCLEGEADIRP